MKNLVGLLVCLILASTAWAQDIDESRMNRDIKIAEDIISGLISQEGNSRSIFGKAKVSGNYVKDYGVIFNIPLKNGFWPLGLKIWDEDGSITISDQATGTKYQIKGDDYKSLDSSDLEEYMESRDGYMQSIMETFLVDYADLIGQLDSSEKIMLKSENKQEGVFVIGGGDQRYSFNFKDGDQDDDHEDKDKDKDKDECCEGIEGGGYVLSAEVTKGDISAYKSGQIDRDELLERIQVDQTATMDEKEPDLELLSTIFQRLYKSDLSDTYFSTRTPEYDRIAKFGVIYKWRVYSSNTEGSKHNMPTIDAYNLTSEERNRKVEELYPKFKEQFRKNMVEYGRTLKGLEEDDILMFKIRMTECKGCTIPKSLDLSVKRSVLDNYEKQKIDLKTAASQVSVNENMTD